MARPLHRVSNYCGFVTFVILTTSFEGFWRASADVADLLPNGWPGQPGKANFGQYAGYVQLPGTKKYFYYAFVEAEGNATKKPLVVWMNGGPGCSSLGGGFFAENGPWRLKNSSGTDLVRNPYAWNKEANMIFVESPAGVGFSFSNISADYKTNDSVTSLDNYRFLVGWLTKFPSYKTRPLYLSGESYAGHYIPQLAKQILDRNKYPSNFQIKIKINLKGVIIGNPYMDLKNDDLGTQFSLNSFFQGYNYYSDSFDPYNAFASVCTFKGPDIGLKSNQRGSILYHESFYEKARERRKSKTKKQTTSNPEVRGVKKGSMKKPAPSTVPKPFSIDNTECHDYWINKYLNTPSVQRAIHVKSGGIKWFVCSIRCTDFEGDCKNKLSYYDDVPSTVNILKYLIEENLQVWLYSGDTDTVVPFYGTRKNIESLKLPLKNYDYYPWYYYDQGSGWIGEYKGLTAVTVKGAGHFVPYDKPEISLYLIKQFLAKETLPQLPFEFDYTVAYP